MKQSLLLFVLPLALLAQTAPTQSAANSAAVTSAPPAATAAAGDPVVLTVGDQKITRSQFESIVGTLPKNQQSALSNPAERRKLADELAGMEALATVARQRKLDQAPPVQQMLRMQSDSVLANALVRQQMAADHANPTALHQYYDQHKNEYEQVKAVHILIRFKGSPVPVRTGQKDLTDAEALAKAQEIRQKLAAGADFAQLAKTESDDTGSAAQGGQLPAFSHGQMVAEFDKAAFELKPGELSQPVKTQFGYHIIKVQEHTTKTFEQAEPEVEQQMARAFVESVKKQVPLTFDETYFGKE